MWLVQKPGDYMLKKFLETKNSDELLIASSLTQLLLHFPEVMWFFFKIAGDYGDFSKYETILVKIGSYVCIINNTFLKIISVMSSRLPVFWVHSRSL